MNEILKAVGVSRRFDDGDRKLDVLRDINLSMATGERVFVFGRSGSGKSTLLHILAGLDDLSSGEVWVADEHMGELSQNERAALRNRTMGFVYQFHHLLPEFTALENVAMPLLIRGVNRKRALEQSRDLLVEVELQDRATHLPKQLSGGECLRVAVARAIVGEPSIVLADEPTGSLDATSAEQVMRLLVNLSHNHDTALIVVTHDEASERYSTRTLHLKEGELTQ